MITDSKQFNEQIELSLKSFNEKLIKKIQNLLNNENLSNVKKNFLTECIIFYSSCNTLLTTAKNDPKFFDTLQGQMLSYPILRRLLEVFFNQAYIFDDEDEIENRYNEYIKFINNQYIKMYNDLEEIKSPYLSLLPQLSKTQSKYGDLNARLLQMKNDNNDKLSYLYVNYRILSFYAHGNINDILVKALFDNQTNMFPYVKPKNLLGLIANTYLNILGKYFNDNIRIFYV